MSKCVSASAITGLTSQTVHVPVSCIIIMIHSHSGCMSVSFTFLLLTVYTYRVVNPVGYYKYITPVLIVMLCDDAWMTLQGFTNHDPKKFKYTERIECPICRL